MREVEFAHEQHGCYQPRYVVPKDALLKPLQAKGANQEQRCGESIDDNVSW